MMKLVTLYTFAIILIGGGINHIFNPKFYNRFIPEVFPKKLVNYVSGVVEIALGVGLLFSETRYWSALGILILMIAFLPLHVIDLFRAKPAIGSRTLAIIRLPIQFLLIWGAWWLMQS
jgi:uncharacterized membrane protein